MSERTDPHAANWDGYGQPTFVTRVVHEREPETTPKLYLPDGILLVERKRPIGFGQ